MRGGEEGRRYVESLVEAEKMTTEECKRLGGENRSIRESKEEIEKRVKERWEGKGGRNRIREVMEELI